MNAWPGRRTATWARTGPRTSTTSRHVATPARLSPRGRLRLPDDLPPAVVRAVEATATSLGDDGWVEAEIPTESASHACGELLRLGGAVEAVAPAEPRRAMAGTVAVLARAYGVAGRVSGGIRVGVEAATGE
ncbi:WYL domain-containing protein [Streptomyces sp. NPDC053755]|uniref:WYL domain-containing protein n=1 Tax=Streptomyces sp. NPDC053755 TaxID=3155815 RepID=UPI003413E91D